MREISKFGTEMARQQSSREINFTCERELSAMNSGELNKVINNFRRFKAVQLEKLRTNNPNFAMQATEQDHKFERTKVLEFIEKMAKEETIPPESMDASYWDADAVVDWYNTEREKQNKSSAAA